jgi:hypothetical protein
MERMGLKRTSSKLIVKGNLGWTRRKKAGYRDVVDIPIHCGSTMEHHYVDGKVEEDDGSGTDRTDCISFGSSVVNTTLDNSDNISHRTAKDAPGWIRDVGKDPYVRTRQASLTQCLSSNTSQTQSSVTSTTESCPCADDKPRRTVIPSFVPADFNDDSVLISTSGLPGRNQTQQPMTEIASTLKFAEEHEIELLSKGSSSNSSTSLPPPGFVLPRKEIRDAILYHEELGKALSLLALDPDMKCIGNNGGNHSVASTDSTELSTFNTSYSSNRGCRVGALHLRPTSPTQRNANVEFDDRMEQVSSMETASSRSEFGCGSNQRALLEQQLSFLESHTIQQVIPSSQMDGRRGHSIDSVPNYNSTVQSEPFDDFFFPGTDDLQSFPASATSCDVSRCTSSPPNTPTLNPLRNDNNVNQQLWFGQTHNERIDGIRLIKKEIALVMSEYNDKTLSDISVTVDTQLEKHLTKLKSDVSELSERLGNTARVCIPTDHCQGKKENHASNLNKPPSIPHSENFVEDKGLLHEIQKAFSSMETRIVNTIASEMKANVMQQRQTIEEMVEEKISAAIAGSNLKIISDVQQIIQQEGQSSMMTLGDKASPHTSSLRIDSLRKHHSRGPQSTMLESVDSADIRTRSSAPDNSWIQSTSDPSSSANTDHPTQKSLEDSFSDTMKAIDEFVADCDEIASDFDRIALRMEGSDVDHDLDCDTDKFEVLIGTANGFVMF